MKSSAMLALLPGIDRPLFRLRCLLLLPSRSLAGNWTISSVSADEEPTHSLTGRAAFGLKICFVDFFLSIWPAEKQGPIVIDEPMISADATLAVGQLTDNPCVG